MIRKIISLLNNKEKLITVHNSFNQSNFKLVLREDCYIEKEIQQFGLFGYFEKESLKLWAHLSEMSQVIIDIGANTGVYSILARNCNSNAQIIAVEPISVNYKVLNQNIKKNKYYIFSEEVALSNKEGVAKMFMFKDKLNYMTSVNKNRYENNPEITQGKEVVEVEVPLMMFSSLYNKYKLDKIDLIKIDVEGHEIEVLESMFELIEKYTPNILIEVLTDEIANSISKMVQSLKYHFIFIDEINTPRKVEKLENNSSHNYLICNSSTFSYLVANKLILNE